jgi:hypothetical protein
LEKYSESSSSVAQRDALRKMVLLRWSVGAVGNNTHARVHQMPGVVQVRAGPDLALCSCTWFVRSKFGSLYFKRGNFQFGFNSHYSTSPVRFCRSVRIRKKSKHPALKIRKMGFINVYCATGTFPPRQGKYPAPLAFSKRFITQLKVTFGNSSWV